ncbi:hypothetical protein CpipJ_CPIJ015603 [Culex quinquefasciatus]|uniref:Uncharacterized protein n=1 Tax=Culex quinquefasciatus TaxID=7176 RepID=B0X808_CULQU|nr:hypothetical protein CpipJ_CPIJ015603 [Culex quinquefasciatus]|eukprot:XP_001865780.1 hypothetical protein CpipJ_CPIJ015603 [Culex quinquefasciatus]
MAMATEYSFYKHKLGGRRKGKSHPNKLNYRGNHLHKLAATCSRRRNLHQK